mgnify:CR=1 FL=1
MPAPKQVQKQTEAVQQLYADLNDPSVGSPENGEPVVALVKDSASAPTPADSVGENAPDPATIEPVAGNQSEDWQQKYLSLQGMYNADVPRLTAENQELSTRMGQMEGLIATMQSAPAPEPVPEPKAVSLLTEEDIEEYGESIDIMRKVSQEIAGQYQGQIDNLQSTINELRGTVVPRVEQIAGAQAQSAEQQFWADLSYAAPKWQDINENQDFQSWLLTVDELSGLTRQTYLEDAQRNLDASRVAGFFNSWLKATGADIAQPNGTVSQTELERQVTPGKSRSSGTPSSNEPKNYTPQDIAKFFDDVRMGKFKGKEEERDKLERDIFAAQRDGRIVNA